MDKKKRKKQYYKKKQLLSKKVNLLRKKKKKFRAFIKYFKWKSTNLSFKLKNLFAFKLKRRKIKFRDIRLNYTIRTQYIRDLDLFFLLKKKYKPRRKGHFILFKSKISTALMLKKKYLKKISIKVTQNNIFCTFVNLKEKKTLLVASSGIYKLKLSKKTLKRFYKPFINLFLYNVKKYCKNFNSTVFNIIAPLKFRRNIGKIIKFNMVMSREELRNQLKLNKKRDSKQKFVKNIKKISKIKSQVKSRKVESERKLSSPKLKRLDYRLRYQIKRNRYNILVNFINKKCFNGCRVKKKLRKKRRFYRLYK